MQRQNCFDAAVIFRASQASAGTNPEDVMSFKKFHLFGYSQGMGLGFYSVFPAQRMLAAGLRKD